jgi:hypothetical protein
VSDDLDVAAERAQLAVDAQLARVRAAAAQMDPGKPGECRECGEWSGRLIDGHCAPCRDREARRAR